MFGLPIGEGVGSFVSGLAGFIELMLWLLIPAGFIALLMWLLSFKHEVTVVHLTGGKKVIVRDKARKVKDKNGVEKLKLQKTKERIALPPDRVCEVNNKGKISVRAYRTQNGQYIWCKDNGLFDEKGNWRVKLPEDATVEEFEPMNTMDRGFYANEWKEAQMYKTSNIWDTLKNAAPIMGMVIMVALLLIYWQDVTGPIQEVQKQQTKQLEKQLEITEKQARMMSQLVGQNVAGDEKLPEDSETQQGKEDE